MKMIFVRHGKDDDGYRGGWSNSDLIPEGIEQAEILAKHLKENNSYYNITQIILSDLRRTMTTDLAGMRNETALEQFPGLFFSSLKWNEAYPNGESPREFYMRIKIWFEEFLIKHSNAQGNILVVTHGDVINIIYHLVKRIKWNNKNCSFKADYCSVHVLNVDIMKFEIENGKYI